MHLHFSPELFDFLADLRANNDREWFQANKSRYERHVKEPLLRFIEDFEPYLHSISEHFVADARANGGSMFRIYRDVRFSKDKTPYKTQAAVHFRHDAGKSAHAPGRIRDRIVAEPGAWDNAASASEFVDEFDQAGDSLKRPPKGFDPEDPHIEDLKRKDHVATCMFSEEEATAAGFIDAVAEGCRKASPYMEFLTTAVGLPY